MPRFGGVFNLLQENDINDIENNWQVQSNFRRKGEQKWTFRKKLLNYQKR